MQPSVEDLFERFRSRADSRALAALFDRTAPELWRVARHLTGSGHEADDLVQATFLAAIESGARWRRELPLVPWLLGILANKLRMAKRRERRRQTFVRHPVPTALRQPIDDAAHAELRELLHQRLAELPETYRTVLVLQLEHGLSAAEVANALGRSRATVRSQLHRGLELLRNALPAGVAPRRGDDDSPDLRAARGAVLLAAGVPMSTATVPLGVTILMKKLIAVSLALLLGGAWYAWPAAADRPAPSTTEVAATAANDAAPVDPLAAAAPDRAASRTDAADPPAASGPGAVLVFVTWADGNPAAAMWVCLAPSDSADWYAQRWLLADGQGRACFLEVVPGRYEVRCRHGGSEAVEVTDAAQSQVELRLPIGVDVRGTVVDPDGRLVPNAHIVLGTGDDALEVGRSDGNGAFFLRSVSARARVAAFADGFAGSAAVPVAEFRNGPVELRLGDRAGEVAGRVLDANGHPLVGAWVGHGYSSMGREWGPGGSMMRVALTDAAGEFRLQGVPLATPWPLHVGAAAHAAWKGSVRVVAGAPAFVEVQLQRAVRLHGVARSADGTPVRAFVHVVDANSPGEGIADQRPSWSRGSVATAIDGVFAFANLPAGTLLAAANDHHGGIDSHSFQAQGGDDLTWDPVLSRDRTIHGRLVDDVGLALAGWRIVAHGDEGVPSPDSATTADDGTFRLIGCAEAAYKLRAYAPGDSWHAPILTRYGVEPSGELVELQVDSAAMPSCRVVGRLAVDQPADGLAVVLVGPRGSTQVAHDLASGKAFEIGPVPAGAYLLQLQKQVGQGFGMQLVHGLGSCTLAPGQRHELGEVRMPPPGEVEVELVDAQGRPVVKADVVFALLDAAMGAAAVQVRDGRGVAEFAPGSYMPTHASSGLCIEHGAFEVQSGHRTVVHLVAAASVHRQVCYDLEAVGWSMRAFATWRKNGQAVRRQWFSFWQEKPTTHDEQFTPGAWELELELGNGNTQRFPFVVTGDDRGPVIAVEVTR